MIRICLLNLNTFDEDFVAISEMYLNHSGWSFHTHGLLVAFFDVLRGEFYKKCLCSDVSLVIFEYLSKGTFKYYSVAELGRGVARYPQGTPVLWVN